jgi:hypothetical protein
MAPDQPVYQRECAPQSARSAVRKFVGVVLIGGLAVMAAAMILVGSLWVWVWYQSAQVEAYYRDYPLLNLEAVPLGTGKEVVIAVLREQGRFFCQKHVEPEADTRLRLRFLESRGIAVAPNDDPAAKDLFECQTEAPSVVAHTTWLVYLEFADGRLSDAHVAVLNIFL